MRKRQQSSLVPLVPLVHVSQWVTCAPPGATLPMVPLVSLVHSGGASGPHLLFHCGASDGTPYCLLAPSPQPTLVDSHDACLPQDLHWSITLGAFEPDPLILVIQHMTISLTIDGRAVLQEQQHQGALTHFTNACSCAIFFRLP